MKLSDEKKDTKEIDLNSVVLLHTVNSIYDSCHLPECVKHKTKEFIDYLYNYCYSNPDSYNLNGKFAELVEQKYYLTTSYKNIL